MFLLGETEDRGADAGRPSPRRGESHTTRQPLALCALVAAAADAAPGDDGAAFGSAARR
jgi:hypothetical protein